MKSARGSDNRSRSGFAPGTSAEYDEAQLSLLEDIDHIRRQMRLVAVERAEALRMRLFLDRAKTRLPRPLIAL